MSAILMNVNIRDVCTFEGQRERTSENIYRDDTKPAVEGMGSRSTHPFYYNNNYK